MTELYDGESLLQVLFITGLLGGGAAWLSGRAIAQTWRPFWHLLIYMAILGAGVRFIHFSMFEGTLLSVPSYVVDTLYLIAVGSLGWRVTRTSQMVTQYNWLYERTSPVTWRSRNGGGQTPEKVL
jgi:hypothetical protein